MFLKEDKDRALLDTYRHIKLYTDFPEVNTKGSKRNDEDNDGGQFRPCVSFNTVPSTLGSSSFDNPFTDFPGVQLPPDLSLDDLCNNEGIARRVASSHDDYYSPWVQASEKKRLTHKSLADSFKRSENGKIVRVDYPSEPAIFNDALILTRSKNQWHQKWNERKENISNSLDEKNKWFQYPNILFPRKSTKAPIISSDGFTPLTKEQRRKEKAIRLKLGDRPNPRTILCHISGRRHTWVALDWVLRKVAKDTDYIVIVANLPKFSGATGHSHSHSHRSGPSAKGAHSYRRSLSVGPDTGANEVMHKNAVEWTYGYNEYDVENKIRDIFEYIRVILPPKLAVKITVEIVLGKTKKVMLDAVNCYTPDICVEGTLKWERIDNLIVWKSRFLKDVLCTKFSIPVMVVPAKRLFDFEIDMEKEFPPKDDNNNNNNNEDVIDINANKIRPPPLNLETLEKTKSEPPTFNSIDSLTSNNSNIGNDINNEYDGLSYQNDDLTVREKLSLARQTHRNRMMKQLRSVESDDKLDYTEKKVGVLDSIIKQTLEFSEELQNITEEDFKGDNREELHNLKNVITGDTRALPNSKKSMLDVLDTPKSTSPRRPRSNHGKARSGQIKFAPSVHAKDGHKALGNSRGKNYLSVSRPSLGSHSYSHNQVDGVKEHNKRPELCRVNTAESTPPPLRKVVSASNVSRVKSNESALLSPIHSSGSVPGPRSSSSRHKKSSRGESSGGFFSFFRSSGGGTKSRSHSRRNSSESESERSSVKSPSEGKKKKSFFGW